MLVGDDREARRTAAATLHRRSLRARGAFVDVDIADAGPGLAHVLFGADAFPGAFERAHGGTVLLDRIDDAPARIQMELLRVIEDRRVVRVGGRTARTVDVRWIVGSTAELARAVERGRLRADLYYRLDEMMLVVGSDGALSL